MLREGAIINAADRFHTTSLMMAALNGNVKALGKTIEIITLYLPLLNNVKLYLARHRNFIRK